MRWIETAALLALCPVLALADPAAQVPPRPVMGAPVPLSGSDWLSGRTAAPPPTSWRPGDPMPRDAERRRSVNPAFQEKPPVAATGAVPPVGVTRLSEGNPDARGTLAAARAGLPRDLWGAASADELDAAIAAQSPRLPTMRELLRRMLTAQLDPPAGSPAGQEGRLFLRRVDKLIELGWIDAAQGLLQVAGPGDPQRFRRRFDVALLTGEDTAACDDLSRRPGLSPDLAARIYCLAQAGDWPAAALALHGGKASGLVPAETAALLERFLDDSSADAAESVILPAKVTPLDFTLHEAIGEPLSTAELPLSFAWTDLRSTGGWKARLDSAERLARAGAGDGEMLAQAYLEQKPAASGGVWDRTAAFQRLAAALEAGDAQAISAELPGTLDLFAQADLAPALARAVADRLPGAGLDGPAAQAAARLRLLAGLPVETPDTLPEAEAWLARLAAGTPPGPAPAILSEAEAGLVEALAVQPLPDIGVPSRGLALLSAMGDVDAGTEGDMGRAAKGLRRLAELGQAAVARQAAVQLILLPRLGQARD